MSKIKDSLVPLISHASGYRGGWCTSGKHIEALEHLDVNLDKIKREAQLTIDMCHCISNRESNKAIYDAVKEIESKLHRMLRLLDGE